MKIFSFFLFTGFASQALSFTPMQTFMPRKTALHAKELLSEIDIMCIENAADLCSYYDNCDVDERDAILNLFAEQTEIMAERMATMQSLKRHLTTGDHKHLEEFEVSDLKKKILTAAEFEEQRP